MAITDLELPPEIDDLATAAGLLSDGTLNESFFSDPGGTLAAVLTDPDRRAALLRVAQRLLDEHGGRPPIDVGAGTQWVPLVVGDAQPGQPPTGLYLVITEEPGERVVIGLGGLVAHRGDPEVRVTAHLPLVRVAPGDPAALLVGGPDGTAVVELDLALSDSLSDDLADIESVAVSIQIPTGGALPSLVVRLARPPEGDDGDIVLDTNQPLGRQAVDIVVGLLSGLAGDASDELAHLLALFGVGVGGTNVPPLPIDDWISDGRAAVWTWVRTMMDQAGGVQAWLSELGALIGIGPPVGAGTPADPWRIVTTAGPVSIGVGLAVDRSRAEPRLVPTLSVETSHTVGTTPVTGAGRAVPFELALGPTPRLDLTASIAATATIGALAGPADLLNETIDGHAITVGALRAGVSADVVSGTRPVVEAHRVTIGTTDHEVLDLSSVDALLDAAAGAVQTTIDTLLASLGDTPPARALLALFGLATPNGRPTWPHTTSPVALLSDPIATLRTYYRDVLTADDGDGLAAELAALLGTVTPEVSGTGTATDPWRAVIHASAPTDEIPITVGAVVWKSSSPSTLHVGVDVAVSIPAFGPAGTPPQVRVSLGVIEVAIDGAPSAVAIPGFSAAIHTGPLDLEVGGVVLAADDLHGGVAWSRSGGLVPVVEFDDPRIIALDQPSVPVPLPTWDPVAKRFAFGGVPPWDDLEPIVGAILSSVGVPALGDLAVLLGWSTAVGAEPLLEDLGAAGRLRLSQLVTDPLPALRDWLRSVLTSDAAAEWAREVFGWISEAFADTDMLGTGYPSDPWSIGLVADGALSLTGMLDGVPAVGRLIDDVVTGDLRDLIDTGPLPGDPGQIRLDELGDPLDAGARVFPELAALVDGRDVTAELTELRSTLAGTDGMFTAAKQHLAAARQRTIDGATYLTATAQLALEVHAPELPDAANRLFVGSRVDGLADWVGQTADRVIDLTAAGSAIPMAEVERITGDGPWFVVLPTPETDIAIRAVRLQAAVEQFADNVTGDVAIVAHGAAGHAARRLAATWAKVSHFVTVATGHSGAPVDWTDAAAARGARVLTALADLAGDALPDVAEWHAGAPIDDLVALLHAQADAANRVAGVAAEAGAAAIPAGVDVTTVAATITPEALDTLGATLLASATSALNVAAVAARAAAAATTATLGFRRVLATTSPAPGGVRARLCLDADLGTLGNTASPRTVTFDLKLDRPGGWLAGAPSASVRCRALRARVTLALTSAGLDPSVELTLHEASALGVDRAMWRLDVAERVPARLLPEERQILGAVAAAFDGATGALTGLRDLLATAGLAAVATDDSVTFDVDAVEQLLADARSLAASVGSGPGRAAIAAALRTLTGTSGAGTSIELSTSATGLTLDLAGNLSVAATLDAPVGIGGTVSASVTLVGAIPTSPPSISGEVAIGDPDVVRVVARANAAGVTVALEPALCSPAPLYPTVNADALVDVITCLLPAGLIRVGLDWARSELDSIGALVEALGMGAPDEAIRVPLGIVRDPVAWLRRMASFELSDGRLDLNRIARLPQIAIELLTGGAPGSPLPLPGGLELAVAVAPSGDLVAQIGWPAPVTLGPVRVAARVGISLGPDAELEPAIAATIDLLDTGDASVLGGIAVDTQPAITAEARLPIAGSVVTLPLVPFSAGALAGAAQRVLPLVLDALTETEVDGVAIGVGLGLLGDALGVRTGTAPNRRFSGAELENLVEQPELIPGRLATNAANTASGLAQLLDPVVPGSLTAAAGIVTYTNVGASASIDLTATIPEICVGVTGMTPIAGIAIDAELCFTDRVERVTASARVTDGGLLGIPGLGLAPELAVRLGPGLSPAGERIELVGWVGTGAGRRGVVVTVDFATGLTVRLRRDSAPDVTDAGDIAAALVTDVMIPLVGALVLAIDDVVTMLENTIDGTTTRMGVLLDGVILTRTGSGPTAEYGLEPDLLDLATLPGRIIRAAIAAMDALLPGGVTVGPITIDLADATSDGRRNVGLRVSLAGGQDLELFASDELRLAIEVDDTWVAEAHTARGRPGSPPSGVELGLLSIATSGAADPRIDPRFAIAGVGLRLTSPDDDRLIDLGVTLQSVALHGLLEIDSAGIGGGGHLELGGLALPVGSGSGDNAVAASLLGPDESGGDTQPLAATFSPSVTLVSSDGSPLVLFRAGPGDGPWWLPIQRAFGPLYVDQIGVGRTVAANGETTHISLLVDGGASLAGLTVAVDDLSVTLPLATLGTPSTWSLDLAGLAIGYEGSGVKIAGGLRKREIAGGVDYVGMLQVTFAQYGITAVGGYGVFPVPGTTDEYTSLFIFGALRAPIGGPPPFFLTGIGAGAGINRRLIAPTDVTKVISFPLVDAMSPNSTLASNPMQALDRLGDTFPPERGALWFAAGVTFTSFALVETTALLTVEIHDGLEINLLGISRMALPTPAAPVAQIELALQARFSSKEGVLSVIAQLTDNSWLINESCRLTGGFAFVVWFHTGEFVLTIGGYHPRFDKPSTFPDVPRLGFSWEPGGGIVIKGGAYFALTSGAVMTGGEVEVSYKSGPVWARLSAGVNVLVQWDPLFYDFEMWIDISAGLKIRVCFFVCGTIKLSFSFGVRLHIWGPRLRGTATLDLSVISVTVSFGPSDSQQKLGISWSAFRDKYILGPGSDGFATSAIVGSGLRTTEKSPGSGDDTPRDGSSARPWLVEPEFSLTVTTRCATNQMPGFPGGNISMAYHAGPMGKDFDVSKLVITLVDISTSADVTNRTRRVHSRSQVPGAVWDGEDGARNSDHMVPSFIGGELYVEVNEPTNGIVVEIERIDDKGPVHPLPFHRGRLVENAGGLLNELRGQATFVDHRKPDLVLTAAGKILTGMSLGQRVTTARREDIDRVIEPVLASHVAPPRVRSLSAGMADTDRRVVATQPVPVRAGPETTLEPIGPPTLCTMLEFDLGTIAAGPPAGRVAAGAPRVEAPSLATVTSALAAPLGADLRWTAPASKTAGAGRARELHRQVGARDVLGADKFDAALRGRSGLDVGPARAQVWRLPGHGSSDVPQGTLAIAGQRRGDAGAPARVRVVALDRGGDALVDTVVAKAGAVEIPSTASRLLTLTGAAPGSVSGWLETTTAIQVGRRALVVPGATVRAELLPPRRGARRLDATAVRMGRVVSPDTAIETVLPAGTATVVVGVADDDVVGDEQETPGGVLISGAERVTDGNGDPVPPVIVEETGRRWMVMAVEPGAVPVTVGVAPSQGDRLIGVVGSAAPAGRVAADIGDHGVAAITPPPMTGGRGGARLSWSQR